MEKGMLVNIYYLLPLFVCLCGFFFFCKFLIAVVSQATAKKAKIKVKKWYSEEQGQKRMSMQPFKYAK